MARVSSTSLWNGKSDPYPVAGGSPASKTALLRRRPAVGSLTAADVDLTFSSSWPDPTIKFGQVAAVTVDQHGQVVVFHRGKHVWGGGTFDNYDNYQRKEDGPVNEDTVVVLDPHSGAVIKSWGKGLFYMPHGLSIDHEDNLWVTDVALHQIFKYPPLAALNEKLTEPLIVKGERFVNGKDEDHFCKPSAVAVLRNGDFFVSDGYCNARIIKFSKEGTRLMTLGRSSFSGTYGHKPGPYQFNIPHALTLAEDRNLVCAADRENGRALCFYSHNGTFVYEISNELFGSRLFSLEYSPTKGGLFYLVNGPDETDRVVQGFVVNANDLSVVSTFQAGDAQLSNPHDIAVSPDGESVYVVQLDPHRVLKFVHKGAENSQKTVLATSANQSAPTGVNQPSTLAISSKPTAKSIEATNSSSVLPVGLNLMANSSFAKAMTTPLVAITSLMVILLCVSGSGIVWYMRTRRRGRPPVLEFDLTEPSYERSSLMHDDDD